MKNKETGRNSFVFVTETLLKLCCTVILLLLFFNPSAWAQGGVLPLKVNFSESDKSAFGASSFDYFPFRLNSSADSAAIGFAAVVVDSFPDLISGNEYPISFFEHIRVDSVRIKINHVNHSGLPDTLIIGFADTWGGIFPGELGTFVDTLIFSGSQAQGSGYAASQYFNIPVGEYVSPSFSLFIMYKAPAQDTLTLWSGYGYDGDCAEIPGSNRALLSNYFPNSFAYRKEFGQLLPSLSGSDVFFECDTVAGFDTLTDGRSYVQNWDVEFYITSVTLSNPEISESSFHVFPNPGNGHFYFSETLQSIEVYSLNGSCVFADFSPTNSVYLPLPSGFYTARCRTANAVMYHKLIITQ